MSKLGKIIFGTVCGLMVAALIFGIVYAVIEKSKKITADPVDLSAYTTDEEITVSPYYKSSTGGTDASSNIYLVFQPEVGTFTYRSLAQEFMTGTYETIGNKVSTTYYGYSSEEINVDFLTDKGGKYIFFQTNFCSGDDTIPEGTELFDAKFTKIDSSGSGYVYEFHKDGTYSTTTGTATDCTTWKTVEGTYERDSEDPNIIRVTLNSGDTTTTCFPMYNFNGRLIDALYTTITEEEYTQDMKNYTLNSSSDSAQ